MTQKAEVKNYRDFKKINYLWIILGGICFVLLHFSALKLTYLLPAPYLINFFKIDKGTKSMPLDYIQQHGYSISQNGLPSIPYLEIIQQNLLGGKINE